MSGTSDSDMATAPVQGMRHKLFHKPRVHTRVAAIAEEEADGSGANANANDSSAAVHRTRVVASASPSAASVRSSGSNSTSVLSTTSTSTSISKRAAGDRVALQSPALVKPIVSRREELREALGSDSDAAEDDEYVSTSDAPRNSKSGKPGSDIGSGSGHGSPQSGSTGSADSADRDRTDSSSSYRRRAHALANASVSQPKAQAENDNDSRAIAEESGMGKDAIELRDLNTGGIVSFEEVQAEVDRNLQKIRSHRASSVDERRRYHPSPAKSTSAMPSSPSARTTEKVLAADDSGTLRNLAVNNLRPGDLVVVRGINAVSASQFFTSFFGQQSTKRGSSSSVHAMVVVASTLDYASVAHVVRTGAFVDYIRDADRPASPQQQQPAQGDGVEAPAEAMVYRLKHNRFQQLARTAATVATRLVRSKRISFSQWNSVTSVFRDPKFEQGADWGFDFKALDLDDLFAARMKAQRNKKMEALMKQAKASSKGDADGGPSDSVNESKSDGKINDMEAVAAAVESAEYQLEKLTMFCSEFAIKAYQHALRSLKLDKMHEYRRIMDLDGSASSPMCLEGYLLTNGSKYGDWQALGTVRFVFC